MSPEAIVQAQLDAYNAQDIEAFMALFADDCVIADLNGAVTHSGAPAIRERYTQLFAQYPENYAKLVNRIAVGNVVIDHEHIARSPNERFVAAAVYTIKNGLIARIDFIK